MPKFGNRSKENLDTADKFLQLIFNQVIEYFDCSVLYGHRAPAEQFELFKQGRRLENGVWVIENKSKVVTYKDGTDKKSMHNEYPSLAVDVVPYPLDWNDTKRFYMFVGFVRGVAYKLGIPLRVGADWDGDTEVKDQNFNDLAHFELLSIE